MTAVATSAGSPLLAARGLHYHRGGRRVLAGADLDIAPGEAVAVLGPSGSGKSSLLALLAGLEAPDRGQVYLAGRPLKVGALAQRRRFGLVLQGYGLLPVLTAAENVEVVLQARGVTRRQARQRTAQLLAELGLDGHADHLLERLSGGQQQRVALARALVTDPDVLLADEPTAELDATSQDLVLDLLLAAVDRGAALVLATHDPDIADRCGRRLQLSEGELHELPARRRASPPPSYRPPAGPSWPEPPGPADRPGSPSGVGVPAPWPPAGASVPDGPPATAPAPAAADRPVVAPAAQPAEAPHPTQEDPPEPPPPPTPPNSSPWARPRPD